MLKQQEFWISQSGVGYALSGSLIQALPRLNQGVARTVFLSRAPDLLPSSLVVSRIQFLVVVGLKSPLFCWLLAARGCFPFLPCDFSIHRTDTAWVFPRGQQETLSLVITQGSPGLDTIAKRKPTPFPPPKPTLLISSPISSEQCSSTGKQSDSDQWIQVF